MNLKWRSRIFFVVVHILFWRLQMVDTIICKHGSLDIFDGVPYSCNADWFSLEKHKYFIFLCSKLFYLFTTSLQFDQSSSVIIIIGIAVILEVWKSVGNRHTELGIIWTSEKGNFYKTIKLFKTFSFKRLESSLKTFTDSDQFLKQVLCIRLFR